MIEIVRFLMTYEVGINIILSVIAIIQIFRAFDAWNSLRTASFGLEKEVASKKLRRSATVIGLLLLFGLSNFMLISVASIRVPGLAQLATPTIDLANAASTSAPKCAILDATRRSWRKPNRMAISDASRQLEWIDRRMAPKSADQSN